MEGQMMAMTRADWDVFQTNRKQVLEVLNTNPNDFFTAKEIASFINDGITCDLSSFQVGKVLSNSYREGLVSRKYDNSNSQFSWCITQAGKEWTPQPYDWRHAKGRDKPEEKPADQPEEKQVIAPDIAPNPAPEIAPKPAPKPKRNGNSSHPWVATPSVTPKAKDKGAVTRPLPIHLTNQLIAMSEPEPEYKPNNQVATANDREHYVMHLLTIADAFLGGNPIWTTARKLGACFNLNSLDETHAQH
jgi:hypothetical protein